jgi:hypothetical protein
MRAVSNKLSRELTMFKLMVVSSDPGLPAKAKSDWIRGIDDAASALYGLDEAEASEEVSEEEALEDYYNRVINRHRGK